MVVKSTIMTSATALIHGKTLGCFSHYCFCIIREMPMWYKRKMMSQHYSENNFTSQLSCKGLRDTQGVHRQDSENTWTMRREAIKEPKGDGKLCTYHVSVLYKMEKMFYIHYLLCNYKCKLLLNQYLCLHFKDKETGFRK